jgi:acetyl esterase/lipase
MTKRQMIAGLFILSAAALAQGGGRFEQWDSNGDGVLRAEEMPERARLFQRLDSDGDGKVTRSEASRGVAEMRGGSRGRSEPAQQVEGMKIERDVVYTTVPKGAAANLLSLDIYSPPAPGPWPLMVMVHGGGWGKGDKASKGVADAKSHFFVSQGFVFVSVNYRLVPEVTPTQQAADLASALAFLKAQVGSYGGDPARIVLMGHSAGAHLAALVATDPSYLRANGLSPTDLSGVVLLDGAAYNLPESMQDSAGRGTGIYRAAFGEDPDFWAGCSPTLHAGEGPLPPFLVFHAGRREASERYSRQLVEAIRRAGGRADLVAAPDKNHAGINRDIGTANDGIGETILLFTRNLRNTG